MGKVGTKFGTKYSEPQSLVYLSYLRSIVAAPLGVLWTLFCCLLAIVTMMFSSERIRDWIYHIWGRGCILLFGLEVEFRGEENFPKKGKGAICLFNHSSSSDIPILNSVMYKPIRWGAKVELFKIPIFGQGLKALGALPIARANREGVLNLYRQNVSRVHEGECFFLAPEGTRKDGSKIYPFKTGPFIFAIEAQSPVVPVVIYGAWQVIPKGQLFPCWGRWHNRVVVEVLPSISAKGLSLDDRPVLQEKAFKTMSDAFERLCREEKAELDGC